MKFTFRHSGSTSTKVRVPIVETSGTSFSVSAERYASVWNRPLEEIKARMSKLGQNPTEKQLDRFGRWLLEAGMTEQAKRLMGSTG